MEAVARELLGCDIVPYNADPYALAQQVSYYPAELLLRSGDVLILMDECRELGAVVPTGLVGDECVGLQYGFEPLAGVASVGGTVVLLVILALNVYEPRGMTRYGWCKQQEERAQQSQP